MKRVLVIGEHSYIGIEFGQYVKDQKADIAVDYISARNNTWKDADLSQYDTILHMAGKAHADVGNVSDEVKKEYYAINCDLAAEAAKAAKAAGVRQFIYPSSMIIYGESAPYGKQRVITADTVATPANFYGDSKWQADKKLQELSAEAIGNLKIAIVRLPMIYGKGSKGNYPLLAKFARKLPFFPRVDNERSMLYIENLCEFFRQLIENGDGGIFYPQNAEYTNTSDMVSVIAECAGKNIRISTLWTPLVWLAGKMPGKIGKLANKAFGSCVYDQSISNYRDNSYQKYDFKESIQRTEGR
ncbi:MAG: NAD-dependent epimerase/dehydratase family protein [Lachnospiraceae bacterium]|nr:NAD-dependent epimerase/dehydratase family protein [Lachnospiraceae bacterium]